eukprot:CAMPEP_0179410288 /NCGR_PEP_ID=MMETSP0799-20121207/3202_1 /TAXON_ID=46947 /ORGANISM="Geminigera cryophila, Strain CCMP2564" /LENGTH=129 /DNA_ID=CAMNT_0021182117 /DNA_START=164 /DNA_END=553 /DNA_ORIENTATION=+
MAVVGMTRLTDRTQMPTGSSIYRNRYRAITAPRTHPKTHATPTLFLLNLSHHSLRASLRRTDTVPHIESTCSPSCLCLSIRDNRPHGPVVAVCLSCARCIAWACAFFSLHLNACVGDTVMSQEGRDVGH